jgi:hypothetical protein
LRRRRGAPSITQNAGDVPLLEFRLGDLLQPNDPLSLYATNLAIAFNDLVFTHSKWLEASEAPELFYWSRLAFGHYNEVMLYVEQMRGVPAISAFISRLPPEAQQSYDDALRRYDANRGVLNRFRNETIFHYPKKGSSLEAIRTAIKQAQDEQAWAGSEISDKMKDSRMFFADELIARMVFNAAGGTEDDYRQLAKELAGAVSNFMRFMNAAFDQLFLERLPCLTHRLAQT